MQTKRLNPTKPIAGYWPIMLLLVMGALLALAPGAAARGSFHLVGIGPGDGDLLTARALAVIRQADLVFVSPEQQERLSPYVDFKGKDIRDGYGVLFRYHGRDCAQVPEQERGRCEDYHRKQAEFAGLARRAVAAGKRVALLSSGDPTIYGPDIWSLRELSDLDPVLVPGVSAFNAGNAALEVGLGEVIITAPIRQAGSRDTIESLAGHGEATLVIFMPRDFQDLFGRLAGARAGDTPAAVVSCAGISGRQQAMLGTVGGFAAAPPDLDPRLSLVYVGRALSRAAFQAGPPDATPGKGKFYLVGVGPGDPDLATLRALKVIKEADLVFAGERIAERFQAELAGKTVIHGYHRLFPFYGRDCAGLTPAEKARERMSCAEYHQKQAELAARVRGAVAEGKTVAMLDSGDPLVYGPCSWTLMEFGDIATEVVPGLSAFNAANAALRTGVTEGEKAHSVILASGWSVDEMAVHQSAMILFTMRTDFEKFIGALSRHYPADTPVAIVSHAGYAKKEKVMHGALGTVLNQVGEQKLPFEYLLYVGDFLKKSVDYLSD